MTTTVFFTSAADGRIRSGPSTTYATSRAGTGLTVNTTAAGGGENLIGQLLTGADCYCWETFLDFDTSSIPDGDQIDSAVLSIYGQYNGSVTDFVIEARLHDWGTGLTTADWVAGADLGSKTLLASWDTAAGFPTSAYTDLNSDAAFVSNIDKAGVTRIILCSEKHRLGTAPTGEERVGIYLSEQTGTTQDPKLTVNHSAVAGVNPRRALLGVGV